MHLRDFAGLQAREKLARLNKIKFFVGGLDAQQLRADVVDVNMSGLGSASVFAKNSATLKLTGLGSATVYGNPTNRNASARGLGSVSWQ